MVKSILTKISFLLILSSLLIAQVGTNNTLTGGSSDECDLNGYFTLTQGGWSNNGAGKVRDQYFHLAFPTGLTVGGYGGYTLKLTTAQAVKDFLPQGGTPAALTQNYIDPGSADISILLGQVVAVTLAVNFHQYVYTGSNTFAIGDLVITKGTFEGLTVNQFLVIANTAIGGGTTGFSLSEINDAATQINENFVEGKRDRGFLTCDEFEEPVCEGEIGDYVFVDMTGDCSGGQTGSLPIPNVTVQLAFGNEILTTTTDEEGKYFFSNLCAGDYVVSIVDIPEVFSNYDLSTPGSYNVTLAEDNSKFYDADFGYCSEEDELCGGFDVNFDGVTNNNDGTSTWTYTVTGMNGAHDLSHWVLALCENNVVSASPSPWEVGTDPTSGVFGIKWDVPVNKFNGQVTFSVTLNGQYSQTTTEIAIKASTDIFYCSTIGPECEELECSGEIGNYVFVDMTDDCNGGQTGSTPIAGATVQLTYGNITKTTTTDAFGYYLFTELCAGYYEVAIISVPEAYDEYTLSTPGSYNVTLANDDSKFYDADFGYCPPVDDCQGEGVIGDYIWLDANCDGIQNHGVEFGIAGVTVYLKDAQDNILQTKVTNGSGLYKFTGLCAGTYYVFVDESTLPEGYTPTASYVDTVPNSYKHDSNENGEEVILIADDSKDHTIDFGYCAPDDEPEVDIEVEKSASASNLQDGDTFYYTVTVKNNGPDNATGVQVTDVLPQGVDFISYSATLGSYDFNTGVWMVGNLANGASQTLTIYVQVNIEDVNNATFNLGVASDYNLFVLYDVNQPSSDTEGKVAVGRNAYFANYSIGDKLPPNSGDVLIVGNNLEYISGAVYNGNVVYGNSTNLDSEYYAVSITGGTLRQDTPLDFAAAEGYLLGLSNTLFGYTANGTTTMQWGGLKLTGTDPYLNVFMVDGADLSSANDFQINVPNGSVVLVNVSGTTVSWAGGLTVTGTSIGNVLYNFKDATSITIQGIDVRGSILAPKAHVDFAAGVQNGQMVCKSLEGMGQFNNSKFIGNIPTETQITNVAVVTGVIEFDTNQDNDMDDAVVVVNGTDPGNGDGNGGSGNGGWEYVGNFLDGQIVWSLAYTDNGCILVGTLGGAIYKSNTEGTEFTLINEGMNVGFIWSLLVYNGYYFAGTEQGVFMYNGSSWTLVGLVGMDVRSLSAVDGKIYAGVWGGGVYVSSDNGNTWAQLNSELLSWSAVQDITVHLSGNFNVELFVATLGNGICFSPDGGVNWTKLNIDYQFVWSIASTSAGVLFAGTYGDGLYTSNDNGQTWTKVFGVNAQYIYDITVDLNDNVYISTLLGGIFVSTDGGSSFSNAGMGGIGTSSVLAFGSSESNSSVYVGTSSGSIYRKVGDNGVTSVEDENVPKEFKLEQNFPNPFNPSTTIQFAVPKAGEYKLVVYNILGQQVAELLNTQLQPGVHNVQFNANQLASGVYIYQLVGDKVNFTKKMVLMK